MCRKRRENCERRMLEDERGRVPTGSAASAFPASCALPYFVIPHSQFSRSFSSAKKEGHRKGRKGARRRIPMTGSGARMTNAEGRKRSFPCNPCRTCISSRPYICSVFHFSFCIPDRPERAQPSISHSAFTFSPFPLLHRCCRPAWRMRRLTAT